MFDASNLNSLLEEEQVYALQEYESDLHIYISEKNRTLRDAILKKLVDKYRSLLGFNQTDIINHAALLAMPDEEADVTYTLKDLLELQDSLPSWLVPNLIGAGGGLYVVAGAPKTGKTLLFTYQLAFSVAITGEFLGYPCQKGPVLIYECEESIAKVARTFRSRGLSKFNEMVNLAGSDESIIIKSSFAIDADLNSLKEQVKRYKPALVVFDSLRAITKHLPVSENSVDISKYLYTLQKTLNYLQVPGIVIHHMSKGGKEKGLEGVAGSLSIAGASDGIILLYRDTKNTNTHSIELSTVPREGLPVHWKINRTKPSNGYWSYIITEDLGVDPDQHRLERKILRKMSSQPGHMFSHTELAESLSVDCESPVFKSSVTRLVDSLQIAEEETSNGFVLWINASSPWKNITENHALSEEFNLADKISSLSSKADLESVISQWSNEYKAKIWNLLSLDEQIKVKKILNPPEFSKGDWVRDRETKEIHQVTELEFIARDSKWVYFVEGDRKYESHMLEISEDYAKNYSTDL